MSVVQEDLIRIVEAANIGVARVGLDDRFQHVNSALAAMYGRSRDELMGHHWRVTIYPEDYERAAEAYQAARLHNHGYAEVRVVRAGGIVRHVALTVTLATTPNGACAGYLCLWYDISDYRRDQEALALAVESASSGLLMLNREGRILMINRTIEKLFGYSRQELLGHPVEILLPERDRQPDLGQGVAFTSDSPIHATAGQDLVGLRKDGREIPLQLYLNTIDAPGGAMFLVTIIDIAERVQYELELETAKRDAEMSNRAKSDFLARMSHEIRTPMNLIMGMNEILLDAGLSKKQLRYVQVSYRNVKRLLRLINGILDLSKVEAGKLTLNCAPFDLQELLTEAVETFSAAIDQKGLTASLVIDPDLWRYWVGDQERLQQVLLNLIGNSVKFTERGQIRIRAAQIRRADGAEGIRIEVSDTGCGIPREKRDQIFEAFQQGDGFINRRYEGTGLGLAISQSLVRMMGGGIWVKDEDTPGATLVFTVFLPKCGSGALRDASSNRAVPLSGLIKNGAKVLVTDDNVDNSFLVQTYLERAPVVLDFAANGQEALEKRKATQYDLIFMDISMPVMDGYAATREIRNWEAATGQARVPVVALTAHALAGAAAEARAAGCDGHLSKPVERDELMQAIARFTPCQPPRFSDLPPTLQHRRPQFLDNRRNDVKEIQAALARTDLQTVQRIGHDSKGTGRGYGFPSIGYAGAALEQAAKKGDMCAIEEALYQFSQAIEEASREMECAS